MYATGTLLDEVAYISAVLHWGLDDVLDLEHPDRRHFLTAAHRLTGDDLTGDETPAGASAPTAVGWRGSSG